MRISENTAQDVGRVAEPPQPTGVDDSSTIVHCALCGHDLKDDDHHTSVWSGGYAHDDCIEFNSRL